MFRYWMFYGWLMAGTVKKRSLSPRLVFFSCGKQKEARMLPLLRDGCSNSCCETRMQEGAERTANMSRMETRMEALLTADWAKSSRLREQMQLHLPQQSRTCLYPTNWALAGLSLSLFLS